MLAVILVYGVLHDAVSSEIAYKSRYVTRPIATCPDEGHFFKQEASLNNIEPVCYLCFCYDDTSAVCWTRENKRCDLKHYRNVGKRDMRVRRSPLSLGEDLVKDATREFFNKQSPEQCKPYESSFSDGCPPADWCIGCTVCECNSNGRWDCHVLSFCPDKNGKKQTKKRRGPLRNRIVKRQSKVSRTKGSANPTRDPPKKATRKELNKHNVKKTQVNQNGANHHKINPVKGTRVKKIASVKNAKSKSQAKKVSSNMKKAPGNPLVIKKGSPTNKSLNTKPSAVIPNKNNTVEVAQKVVKQFMSTIQKMMKNIENRTLNNTQQSSKVIKKRSMPKQENERAAKIIKNRPKFVAKPLPMSNPNQNKEKLTTLKPDTSRSHKSGRNKRYVNFNGSDINDFVSNETTQIAFKLVDEIETKKTDIHLFNISTSTAEEKYTENPIRLQTNKEIYITDNNVYEERDGIKYQTLLFDISNMISLNKSSNNISLTVPRLYYGNFSFDLNKKKSDIMSNIVNLTTQRPDLATKFREIIGNETSLRLNQQDGINATKKQGNNIHDNHKTKEFDYDKYNNKHGCKFWTLLRTMLDTNKNNTKRVPKTPKRFTKVRRLIRKIFHKNNKRKCYENDDLLSEDCKTIGWDYENSKYGKLKLKEKLKQKMEELRNESETILKTIKIIKGLLYIIELNTNKTRFKINSTDSSENINKLKTIIKATFNKEEINQKLTQDQRTQIDYIKSYIQTFIKSIGKFATILDDIIIVVKYHNKNPKNITYTTLSKNYNFENVSATNAPNTMQQKLKKLKELMSNYNILQNEFINKIYTLINNLETNGTLNDNFEKHADRPMILSKDNAIETNSANIIRNIRKLKYLADKLKVKNRRKRETVGHQDAIEYLLILMEYLLKRHAPTYLPVKDGIDLLIETIKSAPDVKPITKKVLDNNPDKTQIILRNSGNGSPIKSMQEEMNNSQRESISLEVNKNNVTNSYHSDDEDDDDDDKKIYEIYHKFKSFNDTISEQKQDNELDSYIVLATSKPFNRTYENPTYNTDNKDSKKTQHKAVNENLKLSKITSFSTLPYNLFLEEEASTERYTTLPSNIKITKPSKTGKSQEKETNNFFVDTKANLDWIEENFKDTKQSRETEISLSTPKTVKTTRTIKRPLHKNISNLSDMSNDIEIDKLNKIKSNVEELMIKKQMNLLNSLDYTVEKNIEDEANSKVDKYSSADFA